MANMVLGQRKITEKFQLRQDNALNKQVAQAIIVQDLFECNETFMTKFLKRK